jgi:AraC family ethanolamine operon transcriptional activator
MLIDELSASRLLRISKFSELERFRAAERFVAAESIPLRVKSFSATRATLVLPRVTVALLGSFPRILDAVHEAPDAVITLLAEPANGAIINGVPVTNTSIGFLRGHARYSWFEKAPNWYFSLKVDRSVAARGWPDVVDDFALFRASLLSLRALRSALARTLVAASGVRGDAMTGADLDAAGETVLSALDLVFTGSNAKLVDLRPSALHLRLVEQIDARLAADPSAAIYSKVLARDLSVSVRSLHSATKSIRGMSLHRYLKLRRLWLVRSRLLAASPGARIKSFALAHGFWHLGDFSADYHQLFGELPSETLARAAAG